MSRIVRRLAWLPVIVLIGISGYLLIGVLILPPLRLGDACEYAQMTEAFVNHRTPDARPGDLAPLAAWCPEFRIEASPPYFLGLDGRRYSYHFWGFPLAAVPVKLALRAAGANELRAFQVVNALLLIAALSCVVVLLPWDRVWRVAVGLLWLIGPTLWFVRWPHPELYSAALVTMALTFMIRSAWTTSAVLAGLASWQNSPLGALVALVLIKALRDRSRPSPTVTAVVAGAGIAALPYADSLIKFGIPSLLARHTAAPSQITVARVLEVFVDPNIGLLTYAPLVVVPWLAVVTHDLFMRTRRSLALQTSVVVVAMTTAAASTLNWNSHTSGPIRYALWILPLLVFGLVEAAVRTSSPRARRAWLGVLGAGVVSQAAILAALSTDGGFTSRVHYLDHTPLARLVLVKAPDLYNPTPELFAERTMHRDVVAEFAVFFDGHRCRKALVGRDDRDLLEAVCGSLPPAVEAVLAGSPDAAPRYVTFPKRTAPAPPGSREAAAGRLSVAQWLKRASTAPRPGGVALTINQPVFTPRSPHLRLVLRVEPVPRGGRADLYVGAVGPHADVMTLRSTGDVVVRPRFVGLVPSMRTRVIDLDRGDDGILLQSPAGRDLPPGDYEAYAVVMTPRPGRGPALSPDDVIAADVTTFRVDP